MLHIKNLHVQVETVPILKGFNLTVREGEVHVIMGPNGAGKSTLAKVLGGDPSYEITEGEVVFNGKSILELEPEERSVLGLFVSFQYPVEIPGISNFQFLHTAYNALCKSRGKKELSADDFDELLEEKMKLISMKGEFKLRNLNEGFSGGEKKRNEILQMAVLDPVLSILDETDSGLDIDAMRIVTKGVNRIHNEKKGLILITHYQKILDDIKPDFVHIMIDGKITKSGKRELALELEDKGYDCLVGNVKEEKIVW